MNIIWYYNLKLKQLDLFNSANSLFSHKYKLKNHIRSNSVSISNGKIKIRIKLTETLDSIVISSEKKFTGWYLLGWLISFVILNLLGAIIYWLVLKPSDDDVMDFCDEVISELKNNPNSKIAVEQQRRDDEKEYQSYMNDTISMVQEPKYIETIIHNILFKRKELIGNQVTENFFKNKNVKCYEWFTKEGKKLSLIEIKEQFKFREQKAYNNKLSNMTFNKEVSELDLNFKIYNDFCFYEGSSCGGTKSPIFKEKTNEFNNLSDLPYQLINKGYSNSHPFTGKLDNKYYLDGRKDSKLSLS